MQLIDYLTIKNYFLGITKKGKIYRNTEKVNAVPEHKKENKTFIANHRLISLLPIFGKISERLICNSLFNYFLRNKLLTPSQSGFLQEILALPNYYQYYMKHKLCLMKILLEM